MVNEWTRLRELLADLEADLDHLRVKQGVSMQTYESDDDLQAIVEHRLEAVTQTSIDIGRRICRIEGRDTTDLTHAEVFGTLVELGVCPESHRQAFIDIGGLRNVLTHRYRDIDSEQIYEIYHDLDRLERFSEAVYQYLQE